MYSNLYICSCIIVSEVERRNPNERKELKTMKQTTKIARTEYKRLLDTIGQENILNAHFTEIVERTGCSYCDLQNAVSYFKYRKR